jgi:ATP-binding cassette subfamily B protein
MLKKDIPLPLSKKLRSLQINAEDIRLLTETDIDHLNRYQTQWLVVTSDMIYVFTDSDSPEVIFSIEIKKASEYRCSGVIGAGLLQARVDGMFVEILRFSNRLGDKFHKVAQKLDRSLHGESIEVHPEDNIDPRRCPKCGLMLQFAGDVCPRCVDRGATLARIWRMLKPYRKTVWFIMLFLLIGISMDLVIPQLTRYLVDVVLPGSREQAVKIRNDTGLTKKHLILLMELVGILAALQIARMGVNIVNGIMASRIGTSITFDMRGRLVNHLQQLSVAYYDKQQVGSLVGRVAYDTEAFHGFIHQITGGFLFQIIMVVGVGFVIFSINVELACYTLIPAPLVVAGSLLFWRYIYPRYYRFWDASSKQAGMLSGTLSGIRVVKAFSQEQREMDRFNSVSDRLLNTRRGVDLSGSIFHPIMGLVFQLGGWIVWFVGGKNVLQGEMTLGSLMAFFGYLWMFYGPLGSLTQFTNWLTQFVTQAHRVFEILDTPEEIVDSLTPVKLTHFKGEIKFDRVNFGYNRNTPVLKDISLEIKAGEMVGIVGRSGSGKTTVVNLICRFYDVEDGRVLIDGHDVRDIDKGSLRSNIGVVLQEPFLFRGSIWDNMIYGKPTATPEEVFAAAKAGNAHDFIMQKAFSYDTWVGERGAGLSGGERQRIGIARVLLIDPRILILDEATSSVDAESEASIQAALAEVVKGRTTIAIAHRLSTLRNAKRILVVDQGKIIEEGSHNELVEKGGLYAKLVRIQGQLTMPSVERLVQDLHKEGKVQKSISPETMQPITSHHVRWLIPDLAHIHIGALGALHVTITDEAVYPGAYALRCLPVHFQNEYISLRYLDNEKREVEIGIIRNLSEWPEDAQKLINDSLMKRFFVHIVHAIEEIVQFHSYLNFKVETDLGHMEFMLRWQGDRAHDYGKNGKMLIDTDENRYLIPDLKDLSDRDRSLFQRFIYW